MIEVEDAGFHHPIQMPLTDDQKVIQTIVAHTFQKAFTGRIGIRGGNGRSEDVYARSSGDTGKLLTEFAVVAYSISIE